MGHMGCNGQGMWDAWVGYVGCDSRACGMRQPGHVGYDSQNVWEVMGEVQWQGVQDAMDGIHGI